MKIGIMGGSFNPIHIGHLSMAWEASQLMGFEKVFFVVSSRPPHKNGEHMIDAETRQDLVRLACNDNPLFDVSSVELDRDGPSYTIDTMRHFKGLYGDDVHFIAGQDSFEDIGSWKSSSTLLKTCNFCVATRPGYDAASLMDVMQGVLEIKYANVKFKLIGQSPDGLVETIGVTGASSLIHLLKVTPLDISSSMIRQRIKDGGSVKYLVPQAVERYLRESDPL